MTWPYSQAAIQAGGGDGRSISQSAVQSAKGASDADALTVCIYDGNEGDAVLQHYVQHLDQRRFLCDLQAKHRYIRSHGSPGEEAAVGWLRDRWRRAYRVDVCKCTYPQLNDWLVK